MTLPNLIGAIPEWVEHAACGPYNNPPVGPEAFFPDAGKNSDEDTAHTRAICAGCPVWQDCRTYAIDNDIQVGIWGGLTDRTRRRLHGSPDLTTAPQPAPAPRPTTCTLDGCNKKIKQPKTGKRLFCSPEHRKQSQHDRKPRKAPPACARCGSPVPPHASSGHYRYCSDECRAANSREYKRTHQRAPKQAAS